MQERPDLTALGRELRLRRRDLRLSGPAVAHRIGVSPGYIWLIERARPRPGGEPSRPSPDVLERWLQALMIEGEDALRLRALAGYGASPEPDDRVGSGAASWDEQIRTAFLRGLREGSRQGKSSRLEDPEVAGESAIERNLADELRAVLEQAAEAGRGSEVGGLLASFLQWLASDLTRRHSGDR